MINPSDYVPLILFLVIFFMAFSFLETVVLFLTNAIIRRNWRVVVDKLLKAIVHHRTLVRVAAVGSLALVFGLITTFTPLLDILAGGSQILQLLGAILVVGMVLVYLFSKKPDKIVIEKRIHLYIFVLFSIFSYTGIMVVAAEGYAAYEASVKESLVTPVVQSIEKDYESRVEDRLMEVVRDMVKDGECPYYDYADQKDVRGITQFIFMRDDPALRTGDISPRDIRQPGEPLAGKRCVHETVFTLTPEGKWYEVLEQSFN
jgi:hypothetical protein